MISRVWSSCLHSSPSWHKLDPRKRTQRVPRSHTRLLALPKQEHKQRETQSTTVQCATNMMQNMAWYAGCDMRCICMFRKGKIEPGLNLENQQFHRKDELISVEIDIKVTGIGCTVCKRQAKQGLHYSVINSTIPHSMQQQTKLLPSNITTKYMAVMYTRCLTKHEHWATAKSHKSRFKQAWQKYKRYQLHRLSENTSMPEITSGSHV